MTTQASIPAPRSGSPTAPYTVMLVGSAGGHLAQMLALMPWLRGHRRVWVTFELPDAVGLLQDEDVVWAHHPTTRNLPNLILNARLAWRQIRAHRPDLLVSSGAGVAVPFFWLGKLLGVRTVYVEVIDRVDTRTLTARLCSPVTDLMMVQDPDQQKLFPGCQLIGSLL